MMRMGTDAGNGELGKGKGLDVREKEKNERVSKWWMRWKEWMEMGGHEDTDLDGVKICNADSRNDKSGCNQRFGVKKPKT